MAHTQTIQPVTLRYDDGVLTVSCVRVDGTRASRLYDVPAQHREYVRALVAESVIVTQGDSNEGAQQQ